MYNIELGHTRLGRSKRRTTNLLSRREMLGKFDLGKIALSYRFDEPILPDVWLLIVAAV